MVLLPHTKGYIFLAYKLRINSLPTISNIVNHGSLISVYFTEKFRQIQNAITSYLKIILDQSL